MIALYAILGSFVLLFLTLVLSKHLSKIWSAIDLVQFLTFMRFTNLDFPFNLELILSFFDLKTWCGWIPNLFKLSFDYYEINIIVGKTPPGFSYRKKTSFFIYNNSVLLTAFLFGQFIFFVSVIVTYFCDRKK